MRLGWHETKISAICTDTRVVGEPFGVVADTNLAVSLVKISVGQKELDFAIALKS